MSNHDHETKELGEVIDMELPEYDGKRWLVLFDEDYQDFMLDQEDSVALLVDNNQALEILKLASGIVADLSPEHAPEKEPLEAMIERLEEKANE